MKKSIFLALAFLALTTGYAKAQSFDVGTNVISAGIGLGSTLDGYGYNSSTPGFSVQYDRGTWEAGPGVISLGGYLGFKGYKYSNADFQEKWNYTIVGARGAYHFTGLDVENLDVYGGLMLSINNVNFSYHAYDGSVYNGGSYGSDLGLSPFVGAKYYLSGNLAAYGELGFGVDVLNIGLAYKF
jgi:hypothetical protein